MFDHILVPIDDSEPARQAQALAARLCRAFGGRLRLVHWLDVDAFPNVFGYGDPVVVDAQRYAHGLLVQESTRLEAEGVPTEMRLLLAHHRRLGDSVREDALAWGASAIVLGSHGRKGLTRALLGSGAEQILRASPVPALVVRGAGPQALFQRILVAVDGSEVSSRALDAAVQLAVRCGARLHLVHSIGELATFGAYGLSDTFLAQVREDADAVLQQGAARAREAGVPVETSVSAGVEGLGAYVARQAAEWNADLVVAGTHGRRGWRRAMLGSGAEQIARLATTCVLLVPGPPPPGEPS